MTTEMPVEQIDASQLAYFRQAYERGTMQLAFMKYAELGDALIQAIRQGQMKDVQRIREELRRRDKEVGSHAQLRP